MPEEQNINQSTDESQPSAEVNKTAAESLIHNNQPITNMEVHHHPHVEKKNFKEYFLEFLMIFLAVTMGFFAENIREHFAEKKITKEYLETFEQELKHNKKIFHNYDSMYASAIPHQDSVVKLFFAKKENDNLNATSALLSSVNTVIMPSIDVSAYQQLVNSGGLRYIHNAALKDSMSLYAGQIQYFESYNTTVNSSITSMMPPLGSLSDAHDLISPEQIPEIMPYPLLTDRERRLMVTYYRLSYIQSFGNRYLLKGLDKINESLLKMIENEINK